MTYIGQFVATPEGFAGRLVTLTLDVELTLAAVEAGDVANSPDYRVLAVRGENRIEVGAGWKRVGEKAGAYVALVIDDPVLAAPLRANLFQSDAQTHVLSWNRLLRHDGAE